MTKADELGKTVTVYEPGTGRAVKTTAKAYESVLADRGWTKTKPRAKSASSRSKKGADSK